MRTRPLVLLLAPLALLAAACGGRGCAGAAPAGGRPEAPEPGATALRDRIQGNWSVGPSRAASEKMRSDLRKAARGDEQRLAEMMRKWEASTEGTTLELTEGALITREHGREIASDRYEVVKESGRTITLRLARSNQEQELTLEDDDTISADLKDLGPVTLKRRPASR